MSLVGCARRTGARRTAATKQESVWQEAAAESSHGRPAARCRAPGPRGGGSVPLIRLLLADRGRGASSRSPQGHHPLQDF